MERFVRFRFSAPTIPLGKERASRYFERSFARKALFRFRFLKNASGGSGSFFSTISSETVPKRPVSRSGLAPVFASDGSFWGKGGISVRFSTVWRFQLLLQFLRSGSKGSGSGKDFWKNRSDSSGLRFRVGFLRHPVRGGQGQQLHLRLATPMYIGLRGEIEIPPFFDLKFKHFGGQRRAETGSFWQKTSQFLQKTGRICLWRAGWATRPEIPVKIK